MYFIGGLWGPTNGVTVLELVRTQNGALENAAAAMLRLRRSGVGNGGREEMDDIPVEGALVKQVTGGCTIAACLLDAD